MNRAQKVAENLGISLQPSQTGSVPTAPPRAFSGYNPEPDKELSIPIMVNKNNKRRQMKALSGIKRKFESRYGDGDVDEAAEDKYFFNQRMQQQKEAERRAQAAVAATPVVPPVTPRPQPTFPVGRTNPFMRNLSSDTPSSNYRNKQQKYARANRSIADRNRYAEYKKAADYRAKYPQTLQQPTPLPTASDFRQKPDETYFDYVRRRAEIIAKQRQELSREQDLERQRLERQKTSGVYDSNRPKDPYPAWREKADAFDQARKFDREERIRREKEQDRLAREKSLRPDKYAELEKQRTEYVDKYRQLKIIPDKNVTSKGIWGRGRQKEADKIAQALFHKTRFKNVVIKPHGSGSRASMKISLEPKTSNESGDIELYLQRDLKILLFTRVATPNEHTSPLLSSAIKTIIEVTPLDWKIAIDPFLRQKSVGSSDRNTKTGVRILLSIAQDSNVQSRLVSRQDFMRVNRDFRNKTNADAQAEEPPGTGAGLGAARATGPNWQYLNPEEDPNIPPIKTDYQYYKDQEMAQAKASREVRKEIEKLDRAERGGKFRYADAEIPGEEDSGQSFMNPYARGYGGGADIYGDEDTGGYGPAGSYGGGYGSGLEGIGNLGGDFEPYTTRSQQKQDRKEAQARYKAEQQFAGITDDEPPDYHIPRSAAKPWAKYDQNVGNYPSSSRMSQDVPNPTKKRSKGQPDLYAPTSDPDDLMNLARMDTAGPGRRFSKNSPAVEFVRRRMQTSFGQVEVIDAGTSAAKVIVRSPGIEAHLTRKKHKGSYLQVTLEFKNLDFNRWADVFSKLPLIAFPANMAGNPGKKYPTTHKTNVKTLIQEVKDRKDPRIMRGMVDALEKWANHMKARTASGLSGANIIINWNEQQRKKEERKARDERMRARNESKAIRFNKMVLYEQIWYKEFLPLARKIQEWLLRHMGGYQITCEEIYTRFGDDHTPEAIDKALEILRANAAIYSMTNDTYMINMSRLSSALM